MIKEKQNKKVECLFYFILVIIIFNCCTPFLIGFNYNDINISIDNNQFSEIPKTNNFTKDDYNPILEDDKYGLGNITIYDLSYDEYSMGFYTNDDLYLNLTKDYDLNELNLTSERIEFVNTSEIAIVDNLNDEIPDKRQITVKLNETLKVKYINPEEGFLIYRSRLSPSRLIEFYISDNGGTFKLTEGVNYFIDSNNYLVFDYFDYFQKSRNVNFTMYLIWEYDITIGNWKISQINENDLMIGNQQKNFTVKFNYQFLLDGKIFDDSMVKISNDEFFAALIVNLPDKELLGDHSLLLNSEIVDINDYLTSDNAINITLSDSFFVNRSELNLNFTTKFTLKFIDPVYQTWAIDRLVYARNIRQRIYFPSIISGPSHIFLSSVAMYEHSFTFEQVITANSLFERLVEYTYDNDTSSSPKITLPYIILDEICPILINYEAIDVLRIVVFDSIKMPINGLTVKIYYYNQSYGTYISKYQVQLIAPLKTNENGQVTLNNIPRGNYIAEVYMSGKLVKRSDVNTYVDVNYIYTNILHIPVWIIIFGGINSVILIVGILFYLRQKRRK